MKDKGRMKLPQKQVRFFRLSDTMWGQINELAIAREMTASEYIRRLVEEHLLNQADREHKIAALVDDIKGR